MLRLFEFFTSAGSLLGGVLQNREQSLPRALPWKSLSWAPLMTNAFCASSCGPFAQGLLYRRRRASVAMALRRGLPPARSEAASSTAYEIESEVDIEIAPL